MNRRSYFGDQNPKWRGGRVRGGQGRRYWLIFAPDHPNAQKHGYVLEHRLVAEKKLGRILRRDETVHHVNGDTTDNRPENLDVMSQSEHAKIHDSFREHRYVKPLLPRELKSCEQCGRGFEVYGRLKARRFCGRVCYMAYRREVGGQLVRGAAA